MKRLVLTLLAATLVSGALAQNATTFPDIPANHWAAAAVSRIANLGIVIGFPDGTFRGNEAFTRYQAALVISRLLDVVNQNVNSALAMTKSDIQSLRNAVQGVASDVASQGVRLSSAESAIASLSDDVTANKSSIASNTNQIAANASRLDKIEQEISSLQSAAGQPTTAAPATGGVSPAVLRDLQNQIASQRVAIDTAQAQADAAAKRANDAHDLANQAMSQAQQNAAALAAANTALQNLTNEVNKLQSQAAAPAPAAPAAPATPAAPAPAAPPTLGGLPGDVQRNTSDIANIRQFVILLRRDQVALRDRVSALEASDTQQSKDIASLTKRVTALENNPLGISGSIEVTYEMARTLGGYFDVDRAYGVGLTSSMGSSVFSSGAAELNGDSPGDSGYQTDVGEVAQDRQDITPNSNGISSTLTINVATNLNGTGSPNALNNFKAVLSLSLLKATGLTITNPDGSTPTCAGPNPCSSPSLDNGGSLTEGYVIHVDDFTTTFGPIGAAPLTFSFGTAVETTFTPYLVNTSDPGFVASVTSPDFLKFINPSLTVEYTAPTTAQDGSTLANVFTRGAHLSLNPLKGVTVGGSFVQAAANAGDKGNVNADNITNTVYGVDANASVSMFNLAFEWDQGSQVNQTGPATPSNMLLYAKLNVDGSSLPIINSLDVNYRDIPQTWENGNNVNYAMIYDAGNNSSNYPFAIEDGNGDLVGQKGYGASADLSLFILDVSGYYDNYSFNTGADTVTAYGADATANLFAGFSLSGFFHSVTLDGTVVNNLEDNYDNTGTPVIGTDVSLDHNYDTGFGVTLKHDGTASNALIPNLNLSATYSQTGQSYGIRTIDVSGDYKLSVAFVTLTPYGEYKTVSYASTYTQNNDGTTTIQGGAGLTTTPLSVPLAPSLLGAVNYRTTNHTGAGAPGTQNPFTSTEFQWSVGVMLNKFLFPHSTLTAKYGSWSGQNIEFATQTGGVNCYDSAGNTSQCNDMATDISNGDVAPSTVGSDSHQSVNGYEVSWNYYDLVLSYGNYVNSRQASGAGASSQSSAEAFKISYTVNF
jgi:predicted  nucleic acid-binding Zn-ribbon protein